MKQLLEEEEKLYRQELQSIIDRSGNNVFPSSTPGRMTDRFTGAPPNLSARVEQMRRRVEELQSARLDKPMFTRSVRACMIIELCQAFRMLTCLKGCCI